MAAIAQSAVLVPSSADIDLDALDHHHLPESDGSREAPHRAQKPQLRVSGPKGDFNNVERLLACYPSLGFQASHFGQAVALARKMLVKQPPSTIYTIQDGEFVKVEPDASAEAGDDDTEVYPTLFMGITATLMGTGCREAVRFLVQEGVAPRGTGESTHTTVAEPDFTELKRSFGLYAAKQLFSGTPFATDANRCSDGGIPERLQCVGAHRPFLAALVMSGGGPEHDIRRACQSYRVEHYASEAPSSLANVTKKKQKKPERKRNGVKGSPNATASTRRFGNVLYDSSPDLFSSSLASSRPSSSMVPTLFDTVMHTLVALLCQRQADLKEAYAQRSEQEAKHAAADGTAHCAWSTTPSEVWALTGLWLEDILTFSLAEVARRKKDRRPTAPMQVGRAKGNGSEEDETARGTDLPMADAAATEPFRAEARRLAGSCVLHWAARQEVPIFCPTFADGDIAQYLYQHHRNVATAATAAAVPPPGANVPVREGMLKLDLVRDIHGINKLAMYSKRTGMLICGGGSVKHHVCNANLMRNGADYTVFLSNGQEFDGSDAGARPEEAVSWGKIHCDGESVKVYSEVTVVLPLLVAEVFVPAVRARNAAAEAP